MRNIAVQTINELPEQFEDRDLYIRLHLDYVKYGDLERLVSLGVDKLKERAAAVQSMTEDQLPYPFDARDLSNVRSRAAQDVREAEALAASIKRNVR